MKGIKRIFRISLLRPRDIDREVDDEIAFHLAMREEKLRAGGVPRRRRGAHRARSVRERRRHPRRVCRGKSTTSRGRTVLCLIVDEARRDAIFALRSLRRAKGFTAAVVLTLALGIGANATMYAIINAVVLHPVSGVRDPATLFELGEPMAYPAYRDLVERTPSLRLGAISERRIALGRGEAADHTTGALVSGNLFGIIGVSAAIGRTLNDRDDVAGAAPAAVLTHEYWTRALGGDSSIVGRTVTVNGAPVTVVGIAAKNFRGLHLGPVPAVWLPIHAWSSIVPSSQQNLLIESRNWDWLRVVGRVPPGASFDVAHRALTASLAALDPGTPPFVIEQRARPRPAQAAALPTRAHDGVVRFIAVLAIVVTLVLLTACANIAGLMLSRAAYREREIGVRIALGAGRGRLLRQLLTEALVLATAGGVAGDRILRSDSRLCCGGSRYPVVSTLASSRSTSTRGSSYSAIAITLITGLLVGLVPALKASRADALSSLKGGVGRGPQQQRLRGALVTAQVSVALVLLIGTGLFARALSRAFALDLGFRADPLVTLSVDPGLAQLDSPRALQYYADVTSRVSAVPGVKGATWTSNTPLSSDMDRESADVSGYTPAPGERIMLERNIVGPRYHEVFGIQLVAGRGFDERDDNNAPLVTIINETAANRYFANRSAVGGYVTLGKRSMQIIGVSRDTKYHELSESPAPYIYLPLLQMAGKSAVGAPTLVVRVADDAARSTRSIADAARSANPAVPVFDVATMTQRLRAVLAPQLVGAWLLGAFGVLALIVAAIGIYGVVAYAVSQRTREIGIRMALGARAASVLGLVVRGNVAFVAVGIPIGIALGLMLARAHGAVPLRNSSDRPADLRRDVAHDTRRRCARGLRSGASSSPHRSFDRATVGRLNSGDRNGRASPDRAPCLPRDSTASRLRRARIRRATADNAVLDRRAWPADSRRHSRRVRG